MPTTSGMTDPDGNPIPADDPRLPRPSQTAELKAHADALAQRSLEATGRSFGVKVDADATLDAMVSMFVPPDGPVRLLFEHRVQENRVRAYLNILEAAQRVKAEAEKPRLEVVQAMPTALLDGLS